MALEYRLIDAVVAWGDEDAIPSGFDWVALGLVDEHSGGPERERLWIVTFHDQTLRVIAESAAVVIGPVATGHESAEAVLKQYMSAYQPPN